MHKLVINIEFTTADNVGLECNASFENHYTKMKNDHEVNCMHVLLL